MLGYNLGKRCLSQSPLTIGYPLGESRKEERIVRLNVFALALAGAITYAFCLLCLGWAAWFLDWGNILVETIGSLYLGYAPTLVGAVIGAVWAFVDGFIGLLIFGLIYNWLVPAKKATET